MGLSGDERIDLDSEAWTDLIDRGGLWHVNDETYCLFCTMEEELRHHLASIELHSSNERMQLKLTETLCQSEGLLFHWCILSNELQEEKENAVLQQIVKLYITTRGFAFAASCLEQRTLQKKKAARTVVYTD